MKEPMIISPGMDVQQNGKEHFQDNREDRSELAQEIISAKAGFIERWALLIFTILFLILIGCTWFIRYPDVIEARATLTVANAPKEIIVRQQGRIVKLFKYNNANVVKNEVFGWMESIASHQEVLELSARVDSCIPLFEQGNFTMISRILGKQYANLGELQQSFTQFAEALQQLNDYTVNGFYEKNRTLLIHDISSLDSSRQKIKDQKHLMKRDLVLVEEAYHANQSLFNDKVISKDEIRNQESKLVNKQMSIPQLEASILQNESQQRDKIKALDQLDHDKRKQLVLFRQALQMLKTNIDDWKLKYVLQAPLNGKLDFVIQLQENQFLPLGKLLGYVNPDDSRYFAELYLPQLNFGKVDTGYKVQLRFEAYPYHEFGSVDGSLSYISKVASDSGFLATVRLDNGLLSNTGTPIPYTAGLKANAMVITKNMRLLERLYYNLVKKTSR